VWKREAIGRAKTVMSGSPNDIHLQARLQLRIKDLSRLYPGDFRQEEQNAYLLSKDNFIPMDALSNYYQGLHVLSDAKDKIDCQDLHGAWAGLDNFRLLPHTRPSSIETRLMQQICCLRGIICHFHGKFGQAVEYFEEALRNGPTSSLSMWGLMAHFVAVHCELGNISTTLKLISSELEQTDRTLGCKGVRIRLAEAETYLMKVLWTTKSGKMAADGLISLEKASNLFQELQTI
jgi:hypothetical protein